MEAVVGSSREDLSGSGGGRGTARRRFSMRASTSDSRSCSLVVTP